MGSEVGSSQRREDRVDTGERRPDGALLAAHCQELMPQGFHGALQCLQITRVVDLDTVRRQLSRQALSGQAALSVMQQGVSLNVREDLISMSARQKAGELEAVRRVHHDDTVK